MALLDRIKEYAFSFAAANVKPRARREYLFRLKNGRVVVQPHGRAQTLVAQAKSYLEGEHRAREGENQGEQHMRTRAMAF